MAEKRYITEPIVVEKDGSFIPRKINTTLYLPRPEDHEEPPELLLPGIGQRGKIPPHIVMNTPGLAVGDSLPHDQLDPADFEKTRTSLRTLALQYTIATIKAYQQVYGPDITPDILLESQYAIGGTKAASLAPHLMGNMLYIRPIGTGVEQLGTTPNKRVRKFGGRAVRAAAQGPHFDFYNAYSGYQIIRLLGRGSLNQFRAGLSESIEPTLVRIVPERHEAGKWTGFMGSTGDRLTPYSEIKGARDRINAEIGADLLGWIENDSWHVSLATKQGHTDLEFALDELRKKKVENT